MPALIATAVQLDVLHRKALAQASPLASEIGRVEGFIRDEVLRLRELMRREIDVDSSTFLELLEFTAERFQHETGINTRFISELDELKMPKQVCRELALIVQECLLRVRSPLNATKNIQARLTATASHWQVTIEDDGRGDVRDSQVIRERARVIGGEVTVEPRRLVVTVPRSKEIGANMLDQKERAGRIRRDEHTHTNEGRQAQATGQHKQLSMSRRRFGAKIYTVQKGAALV